MRICFDIGANAGEATKRALDLGFDKVVAVEPTPKMVAVLSHNFYKDERVIPLKLAVSDTQGEKIEFYECVEDGLSTMNLDWLEDDSAPYKGKGYSKIVAYTCTIDWLAEQYGMPELIKIDVEGAEYQVLKGMTIKPTRIDFEWHINWSQEVSKCLEYLQGLGYSEYALQYITHHLEEPTEYRPISTDFLTWHSETKDWWESKGWKEQGALRPTADAGMIWVK